MPVLSNICLTTADAIPRLKAAGWELQVHAGYFVCTLRREGVFIRRTLECQDELGSLVLRAHVKDMEAWGFSA